MIIIKQKFALEERMDEKCYSSFAYLESYIYAYVYISLHYLWMEFEIACQNMYSR